MATKKFLPSLLGIPEEDPTITLDPAIDYFKTTNSRRGSMISLKRENSRRRTCSGCPGCEPQDFKQLCGKLPEFPSLAACHNCASSASESKQRSIRKWLEDVPVWKPTPSSTDELENSRDALNKSLMSLTGSVKIPKRIRSPTRSLSPDQISSPIRTMSPRPSSEKLPKPKCYDNIGKLFFI